MKAKTLLASTAIAVALPLGGALANGSATTLGGPQGTGFYGFVDPLDIDRDGLVSAQSAGAGGTVPAELGAYDRNGDGIISQGEYAAINDARARRGAYSGPSWATNPPVPPE
jgi:hypothetical protein